MQDGLCDIVPIRGLLNPPQVCALREKTYIGIAEATSFKVRLAEKAEASDARD